LENINPENFNPDMPAFEMHTEIFPCSNIDLLFFEILAKVPEAEVLAEKFFDLHRELVLSGRSTEEELVDMHRQYESPKRHAISDEVFYQTLVKTIFYSGFRPSVIDRYMPAVFKYFEDFRKVVHYEDKALEAMRSDPNMIKNRSKIKACYDNAWVLLDLTNRFGSAQNFLDHYRDFFDKHNSYALLQLYDELQQNFYFLGEMTTLNFMTDLGFEVFKPTREVMRAFKRQDLVSYEWDYLEAVYVGRGISAATRLPLEYVVKVLQQFGQ